MTAKQTDLGMEFDVGGSLVRRRTELLADGSYVFEDDLAISDVLTIPIITCKAWLIELYKLRDGELVLISGNQLITPRTRSFGVLYPPFSITQPRFINTRGHIFGIAGTKPLPAPLTVAPLLFDAPFANNQFNSTNEILEILTTVEGRPVPLNPCPSLLALQTKRMIDEQYLVNPAIAAIAGKLGVTHEHLSRTFKREFSLSPRNYLHKLRVADAALLLARGEEIINVSQEVGYNDLSRFYTQFRKATYTSPGVCKNMLKPRRND